jgi:hypothetical protein
MMIQQQKITFLLLLLFGSSIFFGLVTAKNRPSASKKCSQKWTLHQLTEISPLIVEATVVSYGELDPVINKFHVTFQVKKVFKNDPSTSHYTSYIRLAFSGSSSAPDYSNNNCSLAVMPTFDGISSTVGHNRKFVLFVRPKNNQLEPVVAPLRRNRRSLKALKRALCSTTSKTSKKHINFCHTKRLSGKSPN